MNNSVPKFKDRFVLLGSQKFNDEQTKVLRLAYKEGLTEEQLLIIGNSDFNYKKMSYLVSACINNLTINDLKILSTLHCEYCYDLKLSIEKGLTEEQAIFIQQYCLAQRKYYDMNVYILSLFFLENNFSIEDVKKIIENSNNFRDWQKKAVQLKLINGECNE